MPVKIGDRVFCIVGQKPAVEEFEVIEIKTQSSSLLHTVFRFQGIEVGYRTTGFLSGYGKRWFTELEAAEKRLAELGGVIEVPIAIWIIVCIILSIDVLCLYTLE